jgi:hypothetical protein
MESMNAFARVADEFLHSPVEVTAAVVVVGGGLSSAFKKGRNFWINLWLRLQSKPIVPSETLRVVQDIQASFWSTATSAGVASTQLVFDGHVTNISERTSRVLRVEIPKPPTQATMTSLSDNHDARRPQFLNPHECSQIRVMFFVRGVLAEQKEPWKTSLIFIDQYGNRQRLENCVFRPIWVANPAASKEPHELIYQIADPIEKQVASILKAELGRYEICGRPVGGLGSVHIVYRGRQITGVGNDSWTPNSPLNQVLVADPEAAILKSDNLDALRTLYESLHLDEEKIHFVDALLNRLNERKGYLAVAYLIVAALWTVGDLQKALRHAKQRLPENENRVYGLGNVLMLLNGLLKYRYPDFTNEMLDDIERFTHDIKEHSFRIPEKIAAIRTSRPIGASGTR